RRQREHDRCPRRADRHGGGAPGRGAGTYGGITVAPSVTQADVVNFSRHVDALRRALDVDGGTHDIDDVLDKVQRGEAQLWTSPGAVIVSQIVDAPLARELHFWLAAGELQDVITLSHRVMDWGRK